MTNKLTFLITLIIIVITFNSCNKLENEHAPLTVEERTVANYLVTNGRTPDSDFKVNFYSTSITEIPVSYIAVLSNEKSFSYYENMNSNNKKITVKDFPENYKKRDPKEKIAKLVNCKFSMSHIPNDVIEQSFILDKTGQKIIYSDDFMKVTR